MKIFYLLIFFTWSVNIWAGARPVTYNITMDYNAITNRFENARITGGSNSRISVNGSYPIEINTAKDGIVGLQYGQVLDSYIDNLFLVLKRRYSNFNLFLVNKNNPSYKVEMDNQLVRSYVDLYYNRGVIYGSSQNSGCNFVTSYYTSNQQVIANNKIPCSGGTIPMKVIAGGTFGGSAMDYLFDYNNNIKRYLNNPATKVGEYTGSVTYTGDSVVNLNNQVNTEAYTFNFTINKVASLNAINFPNGKISNINVKKINSNFVGNSELNFNVNGVFNFDNKLNFQLTSANTINDKLILKNGNNSIPYNVKLTNITTGKQKLFTQSGQVQSLNISSNDQFQGVLGFSFSVPSSDTPNGNYSDQLTMIVSLDI
ncbi:hypothetical protein KFZ68_17480 [Photobacterium damselae]|uniref:hypothetical protein n=1 Tax=Photobacterium damselae TaxID=38293 RepID=UPI002543443C